MLKGIRGVSLTSDLLVPIIANQAREADLSDQVAAVLQDPRFVSAAAILVRDHGAYIWGADIWEAKRHAEVYHFLFDAVRARRT
jgi:ribulose-5-phosphate 4-epimerase/fuculose-1-phosphate aldolase